MSLWAWAGFTLLIFYYAYRLRHAWITRENKYGPFSYSQKKSPFVFWILTILEFIIILFLSTFYIIIIYNKILY